MGIRTVSSRPKIRDRFDGAILRHAIRERIKLHIIYQDQNGTVSDRDIWPLFIAYLDDVRIVVAWCETRNDYRHFRTDRIHFLERLHDKYPARRALLIKVWEELRAKENSSH